MLRPLLVLLLLLNYLLVVCASASGSGPRPAARAFGYVHSHDCQLRNAWRGGVCFDDCNGTQYHLQKGHKPLPLQQLLAAFKGVDIHCLPTVAAVPSAYWPHETALRAVRPLVGVPVGVRGAIDAPPRRG